MEENDVNESVNNLEVAEQEETVENTAIETETTNSNEEVEEVEEIKQEEQETEKQSNEENARYASIRRKAEEEARGRACKYVFLDTFSFQAPEFYKKHGYKEKFVLEEYPLEGKRHYFTKRR